MALSPSDLVSLPSIAAIKARLISLLQGATPPLPVTSWVKGDPSERWVDIFPRLVDAFLSGIATQAIRGFFLDYATDPGDPGDLSADQTPRPGFLSALGEGWYGTTRGGQTYATGTVTLTNTSGHSISFKPFDLTFHRSTPKSDGSYPSYRNSADPAIYTNLDGSTTIGIGGTKTIPFIAEEIGSVASATPGLVSVLVTQSFGTMTASDSSAAIAEDRENRSDYIARCKQRAQSISPAGNADAYRRAATTARDGTVLQRYDGSGPIGIAKIYVNASSVTGSAVAYFADGDGPSDATDVATANANIAGVPLGQLTEPTGVVPLGFLYSGAAATATNIGPIAGTAKISAVPGMANADLLAAAQQAIADKMSGAGAFVGAGTFKSLPIGGMDQTAGVGVMYTSDIADDVRDAYPGLRAVTLTSPATSTTTIALGHVAKLVSLPNISGAADNGSGAIRLTIGSITTSLSGLATSQTVQVTGIKGTTEANGTWVVTVIDDTHIDLQGSTFSNTYVSGGLLSRIIITVS